MPTELLSYARGVRQIEKLLLRVLAGEDQGETVIGTETSRFTIGSGGTNHVVLQDGSVSQHHLACSIRADGIELRDLRSKNGTFVGPVRLHHCVVPVGQEVRLGRVRLRFESAGEIVSEVLSESERFGGLVGASPVMRHLFAQLEKIAQADATVLVFAETGCGKELVAEALHSEGPRAARPFVVVDCGVMSPQLMQSQLFGHKRGSFTGAESDRIGAFEAADGGTLFLDEIGELPLELQPALLRVLESQSITRVGETTPRKFDVRVVAATNRDLRVECNEGRFRSDLFYRLSRIPVEIPPLRERREDIPMLATLFAQQFTGYPDHAFDASTLKMWSKAPWPGNVRELKNAVERSLLVPNADHSAALVSPQVKKSFRQAKEEVLQEWARTFLAEVLSAHHGHLTHASESLGIDRNHLRRLIVRYQIPV